MSNTHFRRGAFVLAVATATTASGVLSGPAVAGDDRRGDPRPDFTLTLLHGNDQESALLPITGSDGGTYAGAALFTELLQQQRDAVGKGRPGPGQAGKRGALTISAGDHFLPGPQLAASENSGEPIYDATAFAAADWDAATFGNHDFDQTPEYLARWLGDAEAGGSETPFVSGNLGFDKEPELLARVEDGTIVTSYVHKVKGERIGIIGLTTPDLPRLTSLGDVTVDPALAEIANAQAAAYERAGVDKVVLVSHLQDIDNEVALAKQLSGVDVIVGAGGGELLADPGDPLVPNGVPVGGSYPLDATDADGEVVPVVTTPGLYTYVGRLVLTFDRDGELLSIDEAQSRAIPVSAQGRDAVAPDRGVLREVEEPVAAAVAALAEEVVATTEVPLNGVRNDVRTRETNLGNLVTDSILAAGRREAAAAGVTAPLVALQNGGGIRNDGVIAAGPVTALDTFDVLPFANFVAVAPEVPMPTFVAAVERGLSGLPGGAGQFAQAAGYRVTYDVARPPGSRIVDLTLDDGTVLVRGGTLATTAPATISVATIDFLLRGGDGYPFAGVDFTVLPVTYQQALERYLVEDLAGVVTAAAYPVAGEGRIAPAS